METLVFQIGLKQGRSADIYKLQDRELYVGRSYSNDIVLTDPFVAPQQLRIYRYGIESDELSWNINVLDATNPTLINGEPVSKATMNIKPGDVITVGRTQIRVYSDEEVVEPTRKLLVNGWLHNASRVLTIPLMLFAAVCGIDSIASYFFSNTDGDVNSHLLGTVTGMAMLLGWAFIWTVIGRVLRHQPHFGQQLLICTLVAAIWLLQAPLESFTGFFTNNVKLATTVTYVFATALFAYLLHYNLFLATNVKHTAKIAIGFSVGLSVLMYLFSQNQLDDFEESPEYSSNLIPPVVNGHSAISLDDYMLDVEKTIHSAEQ